jgi:DNA primase large subunit
LSIKLGSSELAKYPFLQEASAYIQETKFDFEEFDRPEMIHIINRAVEKLESELKGKIYSNLDEYEIEIMTFLVSLLLIKSIGLEEISRKCSLFEAMRVEKFLSTDLSNERSLQKKKLLVQKIFQELFKIDIDVDSTTSICKLSIADYLHRASKMNEQEWKLINRSVKDGYVYLDTDEAVRLIRNELSNLIYTRIKNMKVFEVPILIKSKADELRKKYSGRYVYRNQFKILEYPPCIKHAMEIINKGENLPHSARFMLATYLLAIGKTEEDVIEIFKNSPDYNEKITRYQVEHLAGKKGSHIKYSVPSCDKLRSEDLCFAIKECENLINPIQFGRRKFK